MIGTADLPLLSIFVAVAETASFSEAARKLGVSKSSVSRGVARLEAAVGAELVHRTTHDVALSTAGAALYERTAPLLVSLGQAVGSLPEREEQPSGDLRITAPNDFGALILADVLTRFSARYPSVRVDVHLTIRLVDLIGEGFDIAIRAAQKLKDSSLALRRLSPVEIGVFASPGYLARRGAPRTLGDAEHDWVLHRGVTRLSGLTTVKPRILCDDFFFAREAARAGAGIALLPRFIGEPFVETGDLARVLPGHRLRLGEFVLLYPAARKPPRKVAAFRDFLLESLKAHPIG
jgi:DNA-binding transcriptional LysR family regulator